MTSKINTKTCKESNKIAKIKFIWKSILETKWRQTNLGIAFSDF